MDASARPDKWHVERLAVFREVSTFPPIEDIANGDLFSLSLNVRTSALTHGLHRFPAKFVSRVPAWALEVAAEGRDTVLDPFCGSGTTLVESLLRCKRAIGMDRDPLACLISRVKTSDLKPARLRRLEAKLYSSWRGPATRLMAPMPDVKNFGHWYCEDAWGELQALLEAIVALDAERREREFFLCVFSSILRWVSNADDQTQKTYVSGTLRKEPPEVRPAFARALQRAIKGLEELSAHRMATSQAQVIQGDATDIKLPKSSVDLVVTSPPYLDSVDYMYNFMLEYFWLGPRLGVRDRQIFNRMRRESTGAKNPSISQRAEMPRCLRDMITEDDIAPGRVAATRAYFNSMGRHFHSVAKVLKKNGRYILTVGNSQTRKGVLPIHDCLIRLAVDAGFTLEKAFAYRVRRHYMKFPRAGRGGIIALDWVITLSNARRRSAYPNRLPMPDFRLRDDEVAN